MDINTHCDYNLTEGFAVKSSEGILGAVSCGNA